MSGKKNVAVLGEFLPLYSTPGAEPRPNISEIGEVTLQGLNFEIPADISPDALCGGQRP